MCGSTPVQKSSKKQKLETQLIDETEDKLESIVKRLKEKHGNAYSGPQYRLWGRMIVSGTHDDEDDPPKVPIITGIEPRKPKKEPLSGVIAGAATAIVEALKSPVSTATPRTPVKTLTSSRSGETGILGMSPGKVAEIRI